MKKIQYQLAVLATMVTVSYLFFAYTFQYFNLAMLWQSGSVQHYFSYISRKFLLLVLPIAVVFFPVIMTRFRPLRRSLESLIAGEVPMAEDLRKARSSIKSYPRFAIIINIIPLLIGVAVRFITEKTMPPVFSLRSLLYLLLVLSVGLVLASIQSSLSNILLAGSMKHFRIYYLDENERKRNRFLTIRFVWGFLALCVFIPSYMYQEVERSSLQTEVYRNLLQETVSGVKTVEQASEEYAAFAAANFQFPKESIPFPLEKGYSDTHRASLTFVSCFLFLFPVSILFVFALAGELFGQIRSTRRKLDDIIQGEADLVTRIDVFGTDETALLIDTTNRLMDHFQTLFQKILENANRVFQSFEELKTATRGAIDATEKIAVSVDGITGSTELQGRAVRTMKSVLESMLVSIQELRVNVESQSGYVNETSSAITEMASSIGSVTHTTQRSRSVSEKLVSTITDGRSAVRKTFEAITQIENTSHTVESFVTMIGDLSSRTNLLAMNAAIEAAHAGSAGRGFAVVAAEIRSLAENSAKSASEIKKEIDAMLERIKILVGRSQATEQAFSAIAEGVEQSADFITEIATAMEEQNQAAGQILSVVEPLVKATGTIRSLTEAHDRNRNEIGRGMEELGTVSEKVEVTVREQAELDLQLQETLERVKTVLTTNAGAVGELKTMLNRFKL